MVSVKKTLERAGADVDIERALPYLYTEQPDGKVVEAVLDVVVTSPGCFATTPLDVTIRCPH
eukprot:980341-Karenia_brevis.AAC.1